jgi:hypothetical protein
VPRGGSNASQLQERLRATTPAAPAPASRLPLGDAPGTAPATGAVPAPAAPAPSGTGAAKTAPSSAAPGSSTAPAQPKK